MSRPRSSLASALHRAARFALSAIVLAGAGLGCSRGVVPDPRSNPGHAVPDRPAPALAAPASPAAPGVPTPLGSARGAVYYEIFVRSFADSDGDGFGDLGGIVAKLDHLNDGDDATASDLDVDGICLTPIFESLSYHGYDVTDLESVHRQLGVAADFERLVDEAHRRGIRVILDLVVNHTSRAHPWFGESAGEPSSPKRSWYVWRDHDSHWTSPLDPLEPAWHAHGDGWYYGVYSGTMPDLNLANPDVEAEIVRIARLWLQRGADGLRLAGIPFAIETGPGPGQVHTPETIALWQRISGAIRQTHPAAVIVGEISAPTPILARYAAIPDAEAGLSLVTDFPLAERIVEGVREGTSRPIAATLVENAAGRETERAPFLTNRDHVRVAEELRYDVSRLRNAAWVLLTLPGSPFMYYGEEIGLTNNDLGGDVAARAPMPWTADPPAYGFTTGTAWNAFPSRVATTNVAVQSDVSGSLLSHYRRLIRMRKHSPALREGDIEVVSPTQGLASLLAFHRRCPEESVIVVHNLSDLPAAAGSLVIAAEGQALEPVFVDDGVSQPIAIDGRWQIAFPPRTSGVWRVTTSRRR